MIEITRLMPLLGSYRIAFGMNSSDLSLACSRNSRKCTAMMRWLERFFLMRFSALLRKKSQ
nr:hypothetical protein Iba_chr03cCG11550 [Ipomoea batatas]